MKYLKLFENYKRKYYTEGQELSIEERGYLRSFVKELVDKLHGNNIRTSTMYNGIIFDINEKNPLFKYDKKFKLSFRIIFKAFNEGYKDENDNTVFSLDGIYLYSWDSKKNSYINDDHLSYYCDLSEDLDYDNIFNQFKKNISDKIYENISKPVSIYDIVSVIEKFSKKHNLKYYTKTASTGTVYININSYKIRVSDHNASNFREHADYDFCSKDYRDLDINSIEKELIDIFQLTESFSMQDYTVGDVVQIKFNNQIEIAKIIKTNTKNSYLVQIMKNHAFLPKEHEIRKDDIIQIVKANNTPTVGNSMYNHNADNPSNDIVVNGYPGEIPLANIMPY